MKEKKTGKSVAKTEKFAKAEKPVEVEHIEVAAETQAADEVKSVENVAVEAPVVAPCTGRNRAKIAAIVSIGVVFAALVADNVYLHVQLRRQAQIVQTHVEQINDLCAWVEHASVQGKWNDGKKSVAEFGRSVAEKFRAAGRKTVNAFRRADDTLNPQNQQPDAK